MSELTEFIKEMGLPHDEYCVVGGAMMSVIGLRSIGNHDVDILVMPRLFDDMLSTWEWESTVAEGSSFSIGILTYEKQFNGLPVEALNAANFAEKVPVADYIRDAVFIDGVPFITRANMLEWKKATGRESDMHDIKLLEVKENE